jgi:hypothetical protein
MHGRDEKCLKKFYPENLKGRDHLGDQGIRRENSIKMDLKRNECIHQAQDRV